MKTLRSDYSKWHENGSLINKRIIYFGSERDNDGTEGGVDYISAKKVIKNLLFLDSINHKQIILYINTPGGCWYNGMAIYDIIKKIKSLVLGIGIGQVMSMGTIILQACRYRYLTKYTTFMIHNGTDGVYTDIKSFENWAKSAKEIRYQMYEIFYNKIKKKHPKYTLKTIEEMCSHDRIMSASDAVKLGLADKTI